MSVGNNKTEGSKGNNFTWQHKVLIGLQQMSDKTTVTDNLLTTLVGMLTPSSRATTYTAVAPGVTSTIAAGFRAYSITNAGVTDALVNGVVLPSGITLEFEAGGIDDTLGSISYNSQLTTLAITTVG